MLRRLTSALASSAYSNVDEMLGWQLPQFGQRETNSFPVKCIQKNNNFTRTKNLRLDLFLFGNPDRFNMAGGKLFNYLCNN
jgi:hypothetical protein